MKVIPNVKFVHSRLHSRSNRPIIVYLINLIFSEVKLPVKRILAKSIDLVHLKLWSDEKCHAKRRFHSTLFGLFLARGTNLSRNFVVPNWDTQCTCTTYTLYGIWKFVQIPKESFCQFNKSQIQLVEIYYNYIAYKL